jgi:hypothetical protein
MTPEIRKQVEGYANSDMRKARNERRKSEHGSILITQTQKGLVDLSYVPETRTYRLVSSDGGSYQFEGTASETVREIVENIFVIEEVQ